ncbi:hypothetical protein J1N35_022317 [Gossypium stocksii]|uniref:Uncharacterized protein n=1 Tax=Gossypium stocksii TaxID=47602 RepID=A0A9D3VG67_9ROSI|nr:hypothetical protein J1N35_022317 [Gossypium stocksii]
MKDLILKKVRFKDKDESVNKELLVDLTIEPITLWKDKLIGQSSNIEDNRVRGRFACMAVYVNLDKLLVSQVLINGKIQKVEYKFLPMVCFHCRRPFRVSEPNSGKIAPSSETLLEVVSMAVDGTGEKSKTYGS